MVNKIAIGYITMNAGEDIRGSILKWALKNCAHRFDYSIVIDGAITPKAREFYDTIPNLRIIDSPWTGRHVDQYYIRNQIVDKGDWLLAMDDDEAPTEDLMHFCEAGGLTSAENMGRNFVYLPSVTYVVRHGDSDYYQAEKWPQGEERCLKRILYKYDGNIQFMTSNCGMHVTPVAVKDNKLNYKPMVINAPYYHMKSLESFIINDSIYIMADPKPHDGWAGRGFSDEDADEIERITDKYGFRDLHKFIDATRKSAWPEELKQFALKFQDLGQHQGKACTRLYVLYYILQRAEPAPIEYTYDQLFQYWSKRLYDIYTKSLERGAVVRAEHTPHFWKEINYATRT